MGERKPSQFPKCTTCENRFDGKDPRASGSICPLCSQLWRLARWAISNDCNGPFDDELFDTRRAAEQALEEQGGKDGEGGWKVVPVVVIEITQSSIQYFAADRDTKEKEEREDRIVAEEGRHG